MFKQSTPLTHTSQSPPHEVHTLCQAMSSPWTCCPAKRAQHCRSPRKRATSPRNKPEEAQGLSAPAVSPFFHFFCRKTVCLGCEHPHLCSTQPSSQYAQTPYGSDAKPGPATQQRCERLRSYPNDL